MTRVYKHTLIPLSICSVLSLPLSLSNCVRKMKYFHGQVCSLCLSLTCFLKPIPAINNYMPESLFQLGRGRTASFPKSTSSAAPSDSTAPASRNNDHWSLQGRPSLEYQSSISNSSAEGVWAAKVPKYPQVCALRLLSFTYSG